MKENHLENFKRRHKVIKTVYAELGNANSITPIEIANIHHDLHLSYLEVVEALFELEKRNKVQLTHESDSVSLAEKVNLTTLWERVVKFDDDPGTESVKTYRKFDLIANNL